jgi:Ca2+-binding EF-hand superfamily protein
MITPETMRDWIAYAKALSNEEITELITEFHKIQNNRADEKRRAAAQKVVEAIDEYLKLGEEISVCGAVYNEDWGGDEEVEATFDVCDNRDGYLTFNFIR